MSSFLTDVSEIEVSIRGPKSETLRGNTGRRSRAIRAHRGGAASFFVGLCLLLVPSAPAQRTQLKPGWNKFSPQDDITLGKRAATDAVKHVPSSNTTQAGAHV